MTFLQSAFLFGLAAVAIPLLIHLFSKRKKEVIPFSTLYFLKILENKKLRNLKLKQLILLILRMLAVAILVFAFAKPAVKTLSNTQGESETSQKKAVLILDNSLSSFLENDGKSIYEDIKKQALEILKTFRDGDELYILLSTDDLNLAKMESVYELETAENIVKSSRSSYKKGDNQSALNIGFELLKNSTELFNEIFLLSDLQKSNFNFTEKFSKESEVKLHLIDVPDTGNNNLSIVKSDVENQILEKNKKITINATIANSGTINVKDAMVSMYISGTRAAQKNISIESGEKAVLEFNYIPDEAGALEGMIVIEEDDNDYDNTGYFILNIPEEIKLLIVSNSPEKSIFLETVYSEEIASNYKTEIFYRNGETFNLRNKDLVILSGISGFTTSEVQLLSNYLSRGGGLILFPDENFDILDHNKNLAPALNLPLAISIEAVNQQSTAQSEYYKFDKLDIEHKIFANIFKNSNFESFPEAQKFIKFSGDRTKTIIGSSNNIPFLAESKYSAGKIAVFSSAANPAWNSFPMSGLFAPIMHRLANYISQQQSDEYTEHLVNDIVTQNFNTGIEGLLIEKPDMEEIKLEPNIISDSYSVIISDTDIPGIYKLKNNVMDISRFAVNNHPDESNNQFYSIAEIDDFYNDLDTYVHDRENIEGSINLSRTGRELSNYFIIALIIIILLEIIVQYEKPHTENESQ